MGSTAGFSVIGAPARVWKFKVAGSGKTWSLPLVGSLPVKRARDIAALTKLPEAEQLDAAIAIFDELCPGLTDVLTSDSMNAVVAAWAAASGITPGESPTSSD